MLKNEISIQNLKNIQNISCLTSTWVSNSLKGHPLVCNLGLQFFKGTYLATVLQSWFIGVRFFKAEICPGSHSLRGYQWSLKDSGVRVGGRIARGILYTHTHTYIYIYIYMRCIYYIYVHLQSCTYISDVSKRGVLGSADDDIACFLHILSILVVISFFC